MDQTPTLPDGRELIIRKRAKEQAELFLQFARETAKRRELPLESRAQVCRFNLTLFRERLTRARSRPEELGVSEAELRSLEKGVTYKPPLARKP